MASVILPSRNEPRSSDFTSRYTNNSNLNFNRLQNVTNPNHNPNPNPSHFFTGSTSRDVHWKNHQQLPSSAPPQPAFISSSLNSVPANSYGYRYITFRLGSYTRRELKELKKRLISDLERVRILRQWICSTPIPKKNYQPPQLELPRAREKSAVGQKRPKPSPLVRDSKKQCGRVKNNAQRSKLAMKKCGQILATLMKHKHGWVFNTPVDAAALKLYDYHSIINKPMDLGTIKSKLAKNEYDSPLAFASDVRLTFQNAMVYNGKGSEVFVMAERLLLMFEDIFNSTHQKFDVNQVKKQNGSAKVPILVETPVPNAIEKPVVPQFGVQLDNTKSVVNLGDSMVRDLNKLEMTAQEKSDLAASLINLHLGREGMNQIVAIMKKGVIGLEHKGDEIELDLGVLDNETLWDLHSFIHKKGVVTNLDPCVQADNCVISEHMVEEQGMRRYGGDEDIVDIGEEMELTNFPSVEIEKDAVNVSSSSNSGSSCSDSDSSSSDSGSDSSSGKDCNEQEANSTPKVGSMGGV